MWAEAVVMWAVARPGSEMCKTNPIAKWQVSSLTFQGSGRRGRTRHALTSNCTLHTSNSPPNGPVGGVACKTKPICRQAEPVQSPWQEKGYESYRRFAGWAKQSQFGRPGEWWAQPTLRDDSAPAGREFAALEPSARRCAGHTPERVRRNGRWRRPENARLPGRPLVQNKANSRETRRAITPVRTRSYERNRRTVPQPKQSQSGVGKRVRWEFQAPRRKGQTAGLPTSNFTLQTSNFLRAKQSQFWCGWGRTGIDENGRKIV
jgi:hypothetical protein